MSSPRGRIVARFSSSILLNDEDGLFRVGVARELEAANEADAASLLRREAVRRARSPEELRSIKVALVGDESSVGVSESDTPPVQTRYNARLAVVRRFLALAPRDARLRRRLLSLLEVLAMKQELAEEVASFVVIPWPTRASSRTVRRRCVGSVAEPGAPRVRRARRARSGRPLGPRVPRQSAP